MADYLVTDTELTSIADAIRAKGGTTAALSFPSEFVSAVNDIPSGGGSSYTLVTSSDIQVTQTSSSAQQVALLTATSDIWTSDKILLIKVRDKAGKRDGYFYGSDSYFYNDVPQRGGTSYYSTMAARFTERVSSSKLYVSISTSGYGVYGHAIYPTGEIVIYARYSGAYSYTIDGTYSVKVFLLDTDDGLSPFA